MSDRFLFRAWDVDRKKMTWGNCNLMLNMNGNKYWDFGYEKPQYLQDQDKFILMQSTGLRDCKGKLIFEGDLLKYTKDEDVILEVFYHDYEARFKCCRAHWQGNRCGGFLPDITSPNLEIIGNIYCNPELLGDKA